MNTNRILPYIDQKPKDNERMTFNQVVELIGEHAKFLADISDIEELRALVEDIYLTQEEINALDRSSLIREVIRQNFLLFNDVELPCLEG